MPRRTTKNLFPLRSAWFQTSLTQCLYLCLQDQGPFCGRRKGVHEKCLCETVCETQSLCSPWQRSYNSIQSAENMNYHLPNERLKIRTLTLRLQNVNSVWVSGHLEHLINSPQCPLWEAVVVPVQNTLCLSAPQRPDWESYTVNDTATSPHMITLFV